jgi:hypothetical protein
VIKPAVDIARLTDLLRKYFGDSPANLAPIESDLAASVFSFDSSSESYVIRIATDELAESLKKDGLVANLVDSSDIPVPAARIYGRDGRPPFRYRHEAA